MILNTSQKLTASDSAYGMIKARILNGEYAPNQMLNEVALGSELGMSRTPVREALNKLEHEMLVSIFPKHGTIVSPINLTVVRDLFQVRKLLEPFIIQQYGCRIDPERLIVSLKLQKAIRADVSAATQFQYEADEDLHQIILAANPNRFISETLLKVYDQNQRIRILTGKRSPERLLSSCNEHISIIDSLLSNDYTTAAQHMAEHLDASCHATIHYLISANDADKA